MQLISFLPLACSALCVLILNKEVLCGSMLKKKVRNCGLHCAQAPGLTGQHCLQFRFS